MSEKPDHNLTYCTKNLSFLFGKDGKFGGKILDWHQETKEVYPSGHSVDVF